MPPALLAAVLVVAGLLTLLGLVDAARGRAPSRVLLQGLFALEALLVVQLVAVALRLGDGQRPAETGAFAGYAVLSFFLLPGGLALSVDERSRWGTLVLAVACLAVAVVELRLDATWS